MNSIVDRVFVINTKNATGRMEKISRQLQSLGILFDRIEAIPICEIEDVDVSVFFNFNPKLYEGWNKNAKSLMETTKKIIQKSLDEKYERILILEDDAFFQNFNKGMSSLKNFLNSGYNWDFIHLNYLHVSSFTFTSFDGVLKLRNGCLCCQAYLINKNVMQRYLDDLNKYEMPIDHITRKIHISRKMSYVISPKMVDHPKGNYSTIRKKIVDY